MCESIPNNLLAFVILSLASMVFVGWLFREHKPQTYRLKKRARARAKRDYKCVRRTNITIVRAAAYGRFLR